MPGLALGAVHPRPDFCPWLQTAPVRASYLLWSPRSPPECPKSFTDVFSFAAHTQEAKVWQKTRHSCIHCFVSTPTLQKSENWFYFLSPTFFFPKSLEKHKVVGVFFGFFFAASTGRCDWFRLVKKGKKKKKKHITPVSATRVSKCHMRWIFSEYLRSQGHSANAEVAAAFSFNESSKLEIKTFH